jgi:hypothetical protein
MKAVFVDTAGWMACADGVDPYLNSRGANSIR